MISDNLVVKLRCPYCNTVHADTWDCLDLDVLYDMRCSTCCETFIFLLKECLSCAGESAFIWTTLPEPAMVAVLRCEVCGDSFGAESDESDGSEAVF
jgi:hypothetical protein